MTYLASVIAYLAYVITYLTYVIAYLDYYLLIFFLFISPSSRTIKVRY